MNRCEVCDKTDEDDPKAGISIFEGETRCAECHEEIFRNLEDLSINDVTEDTLYAEYFFEDEPLDIVQDDDWLEAPVSEVSEQ